jgi:HAE1 family hydrophobic/amphiphilic exporter-1
MNISSLSIRRPVTTIMVVLIILILGFVSLTRLNVDLLPNINIPIIAVSTSYNGAGPKEVESIVTKNVERVLATVNNLKSIRSISSEGNSLAILEFNQGTDMDFAALDIREKLDLLKGLLPDGISEPIVLKLDPNMLPIMSFGISQEGKTGEQLQLWVEDVLKPQLERIEGVASIAVSGGEQGEIKVIVDPEKLASNGLTINNIVNALRMENLNAPGGIIIDGQYDLLVRTAGQFEDLDDIGNITVMSPTGASFLIRDLAKIEKGIKESKQYSRINGHDSLTVSIRKESMANTVRMAEKVNREIKSIQKSYDDINVMTIMDQSEFINSSISAVTKNALIGALLAIVILLVFLKNVTPTFVIAVSIPISVISTFVMLFFANITLNIISLGGLALGVGMMVDNSIVALENIYRMRQEGLGPIEAAEKGASQISMAVVASTLTTICVFLPIIFIEGMTAEIFRELALTITFSLLASLVVALSLVPMLSSRLVRHKKFHKKNIILEGITKKYKQLLEWSLKHRKSVVFITAMVFAVSVVLVSVVGTEFFPTTDQGQIDIQVKMPRGSHFDETLQSVKKVEDIVTEIPEVETVWTSIGGEQLVMGFLGSSRDRGNVTLILKPLNQRKRDIRHIGEEIRQKIKDIVGCEMQVDTGGVLVGGMSSGLGAPIAVNIKGQNMDVLKSIAEDFAEIVSNVEGTREVRSSFEAGGPELKIELDRDRASQYGVNMAAISSAVQSQLQGAVATRYKVDGRELDVRVQLPYESFTSVQDIEMLSVPSPLGLVVPLKNIAQLKYEHGPVKIDRMEQSRVVTVYSTYEKRNFGDVMEDIENRLNDYSLPGGYSIHYGGEQEQLTESFNDLKLALILGVILVYMIMASQFESLVHPFTIMFTVPLAFTGGFLGLLIVGKPLSVPAFLGFIMLAGIVVNNGIVLVDYINKLRADGMRREQSVIRAGTTRLRPILMTSLTTILGLLPLALGIGEGTELQVPLAITVIGGLTLSTVLTLVVVPVIYTIIDDIGRRFKRKTSTAIV